MDANERIIHGTFTNTDETIQAIRRLNEEGYTKDQIRVYSNNLDLESYDATAENPKREEGSFDATNARPKNEEGAFDTTDVNSKARSEEGSFDRVDRGQGINNATPDDTQESANDEDDSVWESVKDFFTPDTYDYEKESQNPNYNPDQDILYPYREDLSRGHHIVVLNNQNIDGGPGRI